MAQLVVFLAAFLCISSGGAATAADTKLPPAVSSTWQGAYQSGKEYTKGQEVAHQGSRWRCVRRICTAAPFVPSREDEAAGRRSEWKFIAADVTVDR
jgi:hypothetical protein